MFVMPLDHREKIEYDSPLYYVIRETDWSGNLIRFLFIKDGNGSRNYVSSSRRIDISADKWAKNIIKRRIKSREKRIQELLYQARLIDHKILFYKACLI